MYKKYVEENFNKLVVSRNPYELAKGEVLQADNIDFETKSGMAVSKNNFSLMGYRAYQGNVKGTGRFGYGDFITPRLVQNAAFESFEKPSQTIITSQVSNSMSRSEERRVGKECRSRWSPYP